MNPKMSKVYRGFLRSRLNRKNKQRLNNAKSTIFCSNCVGGVISNELGLQFLSPTINMFIQPSHFVRFLKDPKKYFDCKMILIDQDIEHYPVIKVEDIVLHCVHFHSLDEVEEKWNSRAKRINWDNIKVIMSERDGCTYEDLIEFDNLPYENKVVFVHKNMPEIKSSIYIPGTELNGEDGHWVKPFTDYLGSFTGKRIIDLWDYVKFLNCGEIR